MIELTTSKQETGIRVTRAVSYGQVTLRSFAIDSQGPLLAVAPDTVVHCSAEYIYDCPECAPDSSNQIILGLTGIGAQVCIYNGGPHGKGRASFTLRSPALPGEWDIAFRSAQAADAREALETWWTMDHPPTTQAVVGRLITIASYANNAQAQLGELKLNGQGNILSVRPGARVSASAKFVYDCTDCTAGSQNQILIGLAGRGAQACIYSGGIQGEGRADFELTAPPYAGVYCIRFRPSQAASSRHAINNWWNIDGAPPATATIGALIVQ